LTRAPSEIIGAHFFVDAKHVEFFWRKEILIMASSNQAVRVPEEKPEVVEVEQNVRPLPAPKTKEPKFVIKLNGWIPS
jgi:hypothetical protein